MLGAHFAVLKKEPALEGRSGEGREICAPEPDTLSCTETRGGWEWRSDDLGRPCVPHDFLPQICFVHFSPGISL